MADWALNRRALAIADDMAHRADELRVTVTALPGGARVIDAGIAALGGRGAGIAMAHACTAGLGHVSLVPVSIDGAELPGVQIWTDHPAIACMASQYAGWALQLDSYFAMGSGPLRAVARVEAELFEKLGYTEQADAGVLVLETRTIPTRDVAALVSEKTGVAERAITFIVAPTASVAGGVQIAARIVETGLHKMDALGFDVRRVTSALGSAPVPPVAKNDLRAIGRTNDCILYGGRARYRIDADDAELEALAARMPASTSADYGTPFDEIFERYERDFYKIDKLLFSPGEVWLTSARTGRTFHAGRLDRDVLQASLSG